VNGHDDGVLVAAGILMFVADDHRMSDTTAIRMAKASLLRHLVPEAARAIRERGQPRELQVKAGFEQINKRRRQHGPVDCQLSPVGTTAVVIRKAVPASQLVSGTSL
jgi:hypothetical protein